MSGKKKTFHPFQVSLPLAPILAFRLLLTVWRAGDKPGAEHTVVRDVCRLGLSSLELSGERDS